MLGRLLLIVGATHVFVTTVIIWRQESQQIAERRAKRYKGEDRISALPDDLLVKILMSVPTKDVVATMILSTRWQSIWKMVPQLVYKEMYKDTSKTYIGGLLGRLFLKRNHQQPRSIWRFLENSLKLHKAPVLETLDIKLGPHCPIDIDVGKWIANAVNRRVRQLVFELAWSTEPVSLPESLYMCDMLVCLSLSDKIFVDVPSMACLPSLKTLYLYTVVYKDEDSLFRLLSSCPNLKNLVVERQRNDNVKKFTIKVPSLQLLYYTYGYHTELGEDNEGNEGSLVIDSPALKKIFIVDFSGDSCLIENNPHFNKAIVYVLSYPDSKFMRSLSSVMYLDLRLHSPTIACCNTIEFSQLIHCKITLHTEFDWLEPMMLLLQHSPNLKVLFIYQLSLAEDFSFTWKQPSSVPKCLSTHLEIFKWRGYGGISEEKEVVKYIFANSTCLKKAGISIKSTCKLEDKEKMKKELETMPRVSTSSQLLFSAELEEYLYLQNEMSN